MIRGFWIGLFGLLAFAAWGRDVPLAKKPLTDEVNLLDAAHAAELRNICATLEKDTSAEIGVAIISSTDGENHHDFALRTFNRWGIGKRDQNNGVLLLFAMRDRRVELIPGDAFQRTFNYSSSTELLQRAVVPLMRANRSQDAVLAGVREVAMVIRTADADSNNYGHWLVLVLGAWAAFLPLPFLLSFLFGAELFTRKQLGWYIGIGPTLMLVGCIGWLADALPLPAFIGRIDERIAVAIGWVATAVLVGFAALFHRHICPVCGHYTSLHNHTVTSPTHSRDGQGKSTVACYHCGYHHAEFYVIPMLVYGSDSDNSSSSSSSSSDSSNYGGGSSSGGGGGASW